MIVYKDIIEKLKAAGYSTYRIRKEKLLQEASLTAIRNGKPIHLTTVDMICRLLQCQPGDILEYKEVTPEE